MDPDNRMPKIDAEHPPAPIPREEAVFSAQFKASVAKSNPERYLNMVGGCNRMQNQMWHPSQMMRVMDPKAHPQMGQPPPKAPNFMYYQLPMMQGHPQLMQLNHQMRMGQPTHPGINIVPQSPKMSMPQPQHHQMKVPPQINPMQMVKPKTLPQMPPHGMFGIQGGKSPTFVRQPPFLKMPPHHIPSLFKSPEVKPVPICMPKLIMSPPLQSSAPKLSVNVSEKPEKVDATSSVSEIERSVIYLMKEQAKEANDIYGSSISFKDPCEVAKTLISGFNQILMLLWEETKNAHKYSLDESYLAINSSDGDCQLVAERDFSRLEDFYRKKKEIEELMSIYRTGSKSAPRENIASGNQLTNAKELQVPTDLYKAQEYADVAYNQRHLLQKITALDYIAALQGPRCCAALPENFRLKQIQMATSLHFDLGTPPRSVSPPPEQCHDTFEAESILSKCYNNLVSYTFSSAASQLSSKGGGNQFPDMGIVPELPNLKLDPKFVRGPQVVPTPKLLMPQSSGNCTNGVPLQFNQSPEVTSAKNQPNHKVVKIPPLQPMCTAMAPGAREPSLPAGNQPMFAKPFGLYSKLQ